MKFETKDIELSLGSAFSGIEGFGLGAKWNGIHLVWHSETNEFCNKIIKKHFPQSVSLGDISKVKKVQYADIIAGGFPCQDISLAQQSNGGAKGIKGDESGLWNEMYKLCRENRYKYIVLENSSALTFRGLEYVLCDLAKIGYDVEWKCLRGYDFGLPDKRERIYIIAYPIEMRCTRNGEIETCFRELHPKRTSRQIALSVPIKRVKRGDDFSNLRVDTKFSKGLDKRRIEALGNSVKPIIASYIFKCIKEHYKQQQPK